MLKVVYGCLTFSLIACVLLFVLASSDDGSGFHDTTKAMNDAITSDAKVLDADAHGAITQTGNGTIRGYSRDGKVAWSTKFDPFEAGPSNPYGAGAIDAHAWCTTKCPDAIVQVDRDFKDFGSADPALAAKLTSLRLSDKSVLAIGGASAALVAAGSAPPKQSLYSVRNGTATDLGVANPSVATIDQSNGHAIVGSSRGSVGFLTRMIWEQGKQWKILKPRLREVGLSNSCLAADGGAIGMVGSRAKRLEFLKSPGRSLGPALGSGTCSVDADGITAVYTPNTKAPPLEAARYSNSGKRLWLHNFGAQRLISKGSSTVIVAQLPGGPATAIDAISGRTVLKHQVDETPFVATDGSIVAANRRGDPRWLLTR